MLHNMTTSEEFAGGDHVQLHNPTLTRHAELRDRLLTEGLGGVPGEYVLSALDEVQGWSAPIDSQIVDSDLWDGMTSRLAEWEVEYPDTVIWDEARRILATQLYGAGYLQHSLDLVYGMHSRHIMADTFISLAGNDEDGVISDFVYSSFFRRIDGPDAQSQLVGFVQAIIDLMVDREIDSALIGVFEDTLRRQVPGYDPLQAWADSQAELSPGIDWSVIVAYIKNDSLWQDVPVHNRQLVMKQALYMVAALKAEPNTELVTGAVAALQEEQIRYPQAKVWDEVRIMAANTLIGNGYPAFALDFGRTINDSEYAQQLVGVFIANDAEEEGLELACVVPDPVIMTDTLLWRDWGDYAGTRRLSEIVQDDSYPLPRRIVVTERLHELMARNGNAEQVAFYEALLTDLRARAANES